MNQNVRPIRFLLNGEPVTLEGIAPTRTVLDFVREDRRCTGTKEGCAEGDCGACTVVVGELVDERLRLRTVNACIQFVPMLDGKALFTVEYLRRGGGELHPVQQAMIDCHGSQCGFCTPGFVMSLWERYVAHREAGTRANRAELVTHLSGNLCRCTGYRSILDAGERMFDLDAHPFDRGPLVEALRRVASPEPLAYEHEGVRWHAPRTLDALVRLRDELPQSTLLAGCTDVGLWINKQFRDIGNVLYVGEVAELARIDEADGTLSIGAGAPLSDAYRAAARHYPALEEMWERFASVPIRNAGTLGGNVANGSPIGDSMPWLIALGAKVVLESVDGARTLALEDLYLDYMRNAMRSNEVVRSIELPLPSSSRLFRTYKLSKRYDSDISAVCAAFSLELGGERVERARVAFGGMAATVKRAVACERALSGEPWNENTVQAAMQRLESDFEPLDDMRASARYRARTAANLLYRFYLETRAHTPLSPGQTSVFQNAREAV